jgi:hypothetical protein
VELSPVGLRDVGEIEWSIAAFARRPNGGLIVTGSPAATNCVFRIASSYSGFAFLFFHYHEE